MTTKLFLFCSLGVKLSTMANPLACFLGFCVLPRSMISIAIMTAVSVGSAIYILVIASYSPVPPVNTPTAAVFMVRNNTFLEVLIGIKILPGRTWTKNSYPGTRPGLKIEGHPGAGPGAGQRFQPPAGTRTQISVRADLWYPYLFLHPGQIHHLTYVHILRAAPGRKTRRS